MDSYNLQDEVNDKYSLRGRVFHKIREDILKGGYKHKEAIKELQVAVELGVSRTPVREALRQLELEGLVTIIPNKGAIVTGINAKDIQDIYAIRSMIEGLCAKWASENITASQIDDLEEVVYLSEFHLEKGHIDQLYELDNKFHEILYEASNSKIMKHVLSDFHHYVQRVRKVSLSSVDRAKASIKEHKAILEALKIGNGKTASELTNKHIENTSQNVSKKKIAQILDMDHNQ
ncbi:GntR family transcriptional regulator [Petrocella sp. FN5]|uniref:GntR family transcriptional regulator n=1 Tax=Petrocella sp. FN5 TaxID=3032002 RepID=UPI0023DB406B|nr:GntR family transcriptional regulator [Petrocella sp. FN5]MDF1616544.1 GntR family transcriptional regulator [Petrocella sp. FN5]